MSDDEYKKVEIPTPLFVGDKERKFFNHIGKELIQKIVGQRVIYYSVSEEHTKTHRFYDEAIRKTVYNPVNINALVLFNEPQQTNTSFTVDTIYTIEIYFHNHELIERDIIAKVGDFVKYGDVVYEIEKITSPQLTYGQIANEVMTKAICRVSRKSQFDIV